MIQHSRTPQVEKQIQFLLDNDLILYEYNMTDQQLLDFYNIFQNYFKNHSWEKSLHLANMQYYHLK